MSTPFPKRAGDRAGVVSRPVGTIRAAFALLTRLPMSSPDETTSGAAAFPIVGAVVGLVGAAPLVLAGTARPVLASLLAIGLMAVVTGVLHLDGLADTADALVAPDPGAAERARKNPGIGPGGVVAVLFVLATQVAALTSLAYWGGGLLAGAVLIVSATAARTAPVLAVQIMPGRVPTNGFAGWFARDVGPFDGVVAVLLAAAVTLVVAGAMASPLVALGGVVGVLAGVAIAWVIVSLRGQLDGDGLGAIVELTLAAALIAVAFAT